MRTLKTNEIFCKDREKSYGHGKICSQMKKIILIFHLVSLKFPQIAGNFPPLFRHHTNVCTYYLLKLMSFVEQFLSVFISDLMALISWKIPEHKETASRKIINCLNFIKTRLSTGPNVTKAYCLWTIKRLSIFNSRSPFT